MQDVIDAIETMLSDATDEGEVLEAAVGGVVVRRSDVAFNERRTFPLILLEPDEPTTVDACRGSRFSIHEARLAAWCLALVDRTDDQAYSTALETARAIADAALRVVYDNRAKSDGTWSDLMVVPVEGASLEGPVSFSGITCAARIVPMRVRFVRRREAA